MWKRLHVQVNNLAEKIAGSSIYKEQISRGIDPESSRCRHVTPEQVQRIKDLYAITRNGHEVARIMGLGSTTVYNHLGLGRPGTPAWTDDQLQVMVDGYLDKRPPKEIASQVGRSARANGYDGHFWGMRKEESIGRRLMLNNRGPLFYAQIRGLWRCTPLADWRWEDVWAYIHTFDVPYSEIYDKHGFCDPRQIRNTSWVTTDGAAHNGRVAWLKYYYPELYAKLAEQVPEIRLYV